MKIMDVNPIVNNTVIQNNAIVHFWDNLGNIITIITLIITIWALIYAKRQSKFAKLSFLLQKKEKQFPYDLIPSEELFLSSGVMSATVGKIEPYIERRALKARLGTNLVPTSNKLFIYGASGIGKTREAVEIIQRIGKSELKKRNIYFHKRSIEVPTELPSTLPYRNIVLFIDDLVASTEITAHKIEDNGDNAFPNLFQRLQETIRFFDKCSGNERINVIITARRKEYEYLRKELPEFLDGFLEIELKKMVITNISLQ